LSIFLFGYMTFWFAVSIWKKRNDVADIAWGLGFISLAWISYLLADCFSFRGLLMSILITIWGLRLAKHIYGRNKKKTEDYRYQKWRKDWGKLFYLRSYLQIYLFQGMLLFVIIFPTLVANQNKGSSFSVLDLVGMFVWLFGFIFESVSDAQLKKFIENPDNKNKIMGGGLWRYSRHPNYFGEVVVWWGLWLISFNAGYGWLTIVSPLTITGLILFVSGIPMLEKKYAGRADFKEYQQQTSIFIPLPPRKQR
jgi:steroid 5-alpha reductase family enzyme